LPPGSRDFRKRLVARTVLDELPVVGVGETKVHELRALVDVGETGTRHLQERLGQRVPEPERRDPLHPAAQLAEKRMLRGEELLKKASHGAFVVEVGADPARMEPRLAERLLEVVAEAALIVGALGLRR